MGVWTPKNGTGTTLYWPGGAVAGSGVFTDTGDAFPTTYEAFFARYTGGQAIIQPGSVIGGGQGIRAQVGLEGHGEQPVGAAIMRAAKGANPWGFTPEDGETLATRNPRRFDILVLDFMATQGREGCDAVTSAFPPETPAAPPPNNSRELDALRSELATAKKEAQTLQTKLADCMTIRQGAGKQINDLEARLKALLAEVETRAKGMKTAAGTKPKGQYQQALLKAAEGLEKTVADYREKAGA